MKLSIYLQYIIFSFATVASSSKPEEGYVNTNFGGWEGLFLSIRYEFKGKKHVDRYLCLSTRAESVCVAQN